ncbi:CHC2 zinc finger domain-containing protein [Spirosoma sp. RP8]|uniref:CHC2 zinc finger domain-containing protein n=1 Tax=Spirosoma liriopis TaxID=2937440 RepID=A0ABT0HVZ4_9BACT|nr:CHC2 zinc finger domain-containing protein [Spirosoma liriopis]MCK8496042.1 CHC2 zinc finger domain-containing protein [Spirosoma liriopis]
MFTEDRILEDLKALDIVQIAIDLGRQVNRQNLIHCTFHNEKTPSLKLYPKDGRFKCFGCGKTGSTIDLYTSVGNGLSFSEAVREMKSRYLGIVDGQPRITQRIAKPVITKNEKPTVPSEQFSPIYSSLQAFCKQYQATDIKRQALTYLTGRAFSLETIRHFGLFVIPDVKATASFLTSTYSRTDLEASGLFSPKGFMFFQHPIVIPYYFNNQIVNLQARCIGNPSTNGWKYQYLRERTPSTMFNIDVLQNLAPGSKIYLTEGAFDTMAITQKGGVAVSINSVTLFKPEWVKLFRGLKVCFFLDSDGAGQEAVKKLAPLFLAERISASTKTLPTDCKDVNEWLIKWSGQVNGYPAYWDQDLNNNNKTNGTNTH